MEKNEMEFGEMKKQLKALQERLDKQIDINEKQMQNAISDKMNGLQRHDMRLLWLCALSQYGYLSWYIIIRIAVWNSQSLLCVPFGKRYMAVLPEVQRSRPPEGQSGRDSQVSRQI